MKRYTKKIFKVSKNATAMVSGGWGKKGPFVFGGVRHTRTGVHAGASYGLEGRNGYFGINNRRVRARIKYNFNTKQITKRAKLKDVT